MTTHSMPSGATRGTQRIERSASESEADQAPLNCTVLIASHADLQPKLMGEMARIAFQLMR